MIFSRQSVISLAFASLVFSACLKKKQPAADTDAVSLISQPGIPISLKGDTMFIRNQEIEAREFGFGDHPLDHLRATGTPAPDISVKPYLVQYSDADRDSSHWYTVRIAADTFEIAQTPDRREFLMGATVTTDKYALATNIRIGIDKTAIARLLHIHTNNPIPSKLIIGDLDFSYFTLLFHNDRLTEIRYEGYLD